MIATQRRLAGTATNMHQASGLDVVGIGALNVDVFVSEDALPASVVCHLVRGGEIAVDDALIDDVLRGCAATNTRTAIGGSTFNVLRALTNVDPSLELGFIGVRPRCGDPGLSLDGDLGALGIDDTWMFNVDKRAARCVCVQGRDGERSLLTSAGANAFLGGQVRANLESLAEYVAASRVVHITSFLDLDTTDAVAELVVRAAERSPRLLVSVDPGNIWARSAAPSLVALLEVADYLFANTAELRFLGDAYGADAADSLADIARAILGRSRRREAVLMLKQPTGARLFWQRAGTFGEVAIERDILVEDIVDATGAGDVFAAGVLSIMVSTSLQARVSAQLGVELARRKLVTPGTTGYPSFASIAEGLAR